MRKIPGWVALALASAGAALCSSPALADFQGAAVPTSVTVMYCDYNPRIVVTFADSSLTPADRDLRRVDVAALD